MTDRCQPLTLVHYYEANTNEGRNRDNGYGLLAEKPEKEAQRMVDSIDEDATSLYRYYDAGGILLYVGITKRGGRRNIEHSAKQWWPFVASQTVEHLASRHEALAAEREVIETLRPPFNTQHNPDHKRLRALYLNRPAELIATAETPLEARLRIGKHLPLMTVGRRSGDGDVRFELWPRDYAIAKIMSYEGGATIHDRATMRPVGSVRKIELEGSTAVVIASASGKYWPFTDVVANVKFPPGKPQRVVIRSVLATVASS